MSACLSGGGRTYGFDLDIVKPSSSSSGRSLHSSSPSSTLSESSNLPLAISIKKARTPRKRPNQAYNEAATLLSTIYPSVFSAKELKKVPKNTRPFDSFPEFSELLPPFPVLGDAAVLIPKPQSEKPAAIRLELKHKNPVEEFTSQMSSVSQKPNSPDPLHDYFDAESILDEEVEEGIDSIMGNLSMNTPTEDSNNEGSSDRNSPVNSLLGSLTTCGGSEIELGLRNGSILRRALRDEDEGDWWRFQAVPVQDIFPNLKPAPTIPALEKKKKKKKKKKKNTAGTISILSQEESKAGLGLKLNHEEVIKAWSDRSSIFSDHPESPDSSTAAPALQVRLEDINLFPDTTGAGGTREAGAMKDKVKGGPGCCLRKVNTDRWPRMKPSVRISFSSRASLSAGVPHLFPSKN
ncbi:CCT motif [Musa troglodytarum]|uniref:CCT motif n=1 Tax=Musa troglodytarum TaxID=320322 RepID=A0A9E7H1J4_9LILI|nr:CCT motif [Musa troglodytarum]URE25810.1 CCT motif [Musa troglodytarum]URE25811.1 CCT motif [Musa troglodytarum]